jgi:hypothetical protein
MEPPIGTIIGRHFGARLLARDWVVCAVRSRLARLCVADGFGHGPGNRVRVNVVRHVRVRQRVLGVLVGFGRVIAADQQRHGEPAEFHGRIIHASDQPMNVLPAARTLRSGYY